MRISVNEISRSRDGANRLQLELLIVTSDATYCIAKVTDYTYTEKSGHVGVYSGTIWPFEIPEVFTRWGNTPVLHDEILEHFRESKASLTFER
mgnify:CR=1 FL=1